MKDKTDDLEAKDTVFAKIDETSEEAVQRRKGRTSQFSTKSKVDDDLGDLDEGDFGFVPEKKVNAPEQPILGSGGSSPRSFESLKEEVEGDVPFGEAEVKKETVASVIGTAIVAGGKKEAKVDLSEEEDIKLVSKTKNTSEEKGENASSQDQSDKVEDQKLSAVTNREEEEKEESTSEDHQPKAEPEEMEIISDDEKNSTALSHPPEKTKAVSKWAFWKRPSRRDEQLARISDGYVEMVDLVRAISGQLESQNENNIILRDSLAHLPEAMKGLDKFNESQVKVGAALQEIHGQMERVGARDDKLVDSMDGFNSTLQGMDVTNRETMKTFDQVQERMGESDSRLETLVGNVQETEVKVSDTMVKLQKSMAIMQGVFLFCLLVVIGLLVFFILQNTERKLDPTTPEKAVTVEEPIVRDKAPGEIDEVLEREEEIDPRPPREIQIPRDAQPLD